MKYKKYVCFGYDDHYPAGGLGDIQYHTDDLQDARRWVAESCSYDNSEIVDRDTWEVIGE